MSSPRRVPLNSSTAASSSMSTFSFPRRFFGIPFQRVQLTPRAVPTYPSNEPFLLFMSRAVFRGLEPATLLRVGPRRVPHLRGLRRIAHRRSRAEHGFAPVLL